MDLNNLPKEALFSLFLQIEPEEIKTICLSKNPKIRQVCNSSYFQEVYDKKYPKKRFKLFLMDNRPLELAAEATFFGRIVQYTFADFSFPKMNLKIKL